MRSRICPSPSVRVGKLVELGLTEGGPSNFQDLIGESVVSHTRQHARFQLTARTRQPLRPRWQGRRRHRRLPWHRLHDRLGPRRQRRAHVHHRPQGRGLRRGGRRAVGDRRVHLTAGRPRHRRGTRLVRVSADRTGAADRHPRQQRRRRVGRATRRVPRDGLRQGDGHQRQGTVHAHAGAAPPARRPAQPPRIRRG